MSKNEQASQQFKGWYFPGENEKPALTVAQEATFRGLPKTALDASTGSARAAALVQRTAATNRVHPHTVEHAVRLLDVTSSKERREVDRERHERIDYVSDVHGGDAALRERLAVIAESPPDVLVFEGDLIGTDNFTELQKLFYNYLNNHSKNEILKENPEVGVEELLAYGGSKPPVDGFTLKSGFLTLRAFELNLEGKDPEEVSQTLAKLSDEEIAAEIKRYADFVHYGHYASNLPNAAKQSLAAGLEENALAILEPVRKMQAQGTQVVMIEGNWDARAPIDFVPGVPTAVPLPQDERLFNPKRFFEANGVPFHTSLETLETKTTLHILVPFDALTTAAELPEDKKKALQQKVAIAKEMHKDVVIVAHGEPNWQIHNMTVKDPQPKGEHEKIINGFSSLLQIVGHEHVDEVVYGHLHDPLTDAEGKPLDVNTKYFLQVSANGATELVKTVDVYSYNRKHVLASYVPFRHTASALRPLSEEQRRVEKNKLGIRRMAHVQER